MFRLIFGRRLSSTKILVIQRIRLSSERWTKPMSLLKKHIQWSRGIQKSPFCSVKWPTMPTDIPVLIGCLKHIVYLRTCPVQLDKVSVTSPKKKDLLLVLMEKKVKSVAIFRDADITMLEPEIISKQWLSESVRVISRATILSNQEWVWQKTTPLSLESRLSRICQSKALMQDHLL